MEKHTVCDLRGNVDPACLLGSTATAQGRRGHVAHPQDARHDRHNLPRRLEFWFQGSTDVTSVIMQGLLARRRRGADSCTCTHAWCMQPHLKHRVVRMPEAHPRLQLSPSDCLRPVKSYVELYGPRIRALTCQCAASSGPHQPAETYTTWHARCWSRNSGHPSELLLCPIARPCPLHARDIPPDDTMPQPPQLV